MSGCKKGLSTLVLNENIKALYTHCLGHRLNLAQLAAAKKLTYLEESICFVKTIYDFCEGSAHRHALFKHVQGDPRGKTLKGLCETRWSERYHAYDALVRVYPQVILFLEVIYEL